MKRLIFILLALGLFLTACNKDEDELPNPNNPTVPTAYNTILPAHFFYIPPPTILADNPMTVEGVELGKKLYYDNILSKGGPKNGLSCSSCHIQAQSFCLPNSNVIPHFNLGWSSQFLWEGKISGTLEDVMLFEVRDFFEADLSHLQNHNEYPALFKKAFNTEIIDDKLVTYALAQFLRTLISGDSRVDKHILKEYAGMDIEGGPFLSPSELRGYEIFVSQERGDCNHCHGDFFNPLWTDNVYRNNGLDLQPDSGVAKYSKKISDLGKFKTPSLRNLRFTAPYMHDGRFSSLEEVIDFYSEGVEPNSPNIDMQMFDRGSHKAYFSEQEKKDLIAFLLALTDSTFTQNPELRP